MAVETIRFGQTRREAVVSGQSCQNRSRVPRTAVGRRSTNSTAPQPAGGLRHLLVLRVVRPRGYGRSTRVIRDREARSTARRVPHRSTRPPSPILKSGWWDPTRARRYSLSSGSPDFARTRDSLLPPFGLCTPRRECLAPSVLGDRSSVICAVVTRGVFEIYYYIYKLKFI